MYDAGVLSNRRTKDYSDLVLGSLMRDWVCVFFLICLFIFSLYISEDHSQYYVTNLSQHS